MNVQANMHLSDINGKNGLIAIGNVIINDVITIKNVRILSKKDHKTGEEKMFISMPGYMTEKEGENAVWTSYIYAPDKEDREKINEAIINAVKKEVLKDINLPGIDVKVTCMDKGNLKGIATINIDGIVINHVKVMKGKNGLFVTMPQYKVIGDDGKETWHDVVYPNNAAMRTKLSQEVLQQYQIQVKSRDNPEERAKSAIQEKRGGVSR